MRLVFTGPPVLSDADVERVLVALAALPAPTEVTTGAALGLDTLVHEEALRLWPGVLRRVVRPAAPHNADLNGPAVWLDAPPGTTPAAAYRNRNKLMLTFGDELVAVLRSPRFYRSGEWMTFNLAAARDMPIRRVLLSRSSADA